MASPGDGERDLFDDEDDDDGSEFDSEDEYPRDDAPLPLETLPAGPGQDPNPISSFPSATAAPSSDLIPIPNPNPNPNPNPILPSYDRKRHRAVSEESRRIFQKLWTDEDEIAILHGFLEFTSQRGTTHSDYQYDTGPFFDQIRTNLHLDFNKNQIAEKLRRLKRKYRNAAARIAAGKESVFKNPHDRATFEISCKIWSTGFKRARKGRTSSLTASQGAQLCANSAMDSSPQLTNESAAVQVTPPALPPLVPPLMSAVEETVRGCLSPLFKEMLQCMIGGAGSIAGAGLAFNPPLQLNLLNSGAAVDERWKQQQILELELFLKRAELVQEQIKAALEELRSADS